jgi:hypothetical protein
MAWLLLRGSGYPFSVSYTAESGPPVSPEQIQDLDKIDCAKQINQGNIRRDAKMLGFTVILSLLALLCNEEAFLACLVDRGLKGQREMQFTNSKYRSHFRDLVDWGVLEEVKAEDVAFFATYFAVPKTLTTMRSIFNGRKLSGHFVTPPPVNISDVASSLKLLAELSTKGRIYITAGDFRHFFHQMSVNHGPQAKSFFGLAMNFGSKSKPDIRCFRYAVLPMGWSFSPSIAQASGWMVLAGRRESEPVLIDESALKGCCLPHHLNVLDERGEAIGLALLYYDNFLVATTSEHHTRMMMNRIISNASESRYNVKLKEIEFFGHKRLLRRELKYLGCQIGVSVKRVVETDGTKTEQHNLTWNIIADKLPSDSTWADNDSTYRTWSKRIGKLIHAAIIDLQPLAVSEQTMKIIDILQRLTKECKGEWDSKASLSVSERQSMEIARQQLCTNEWRQYQCSFSSERRYMAITDASEEGGGYIIVDRQHKTIIVQRSFKWGPKFAGLHIYLLEMYTACLALKWLRQHCPNVQHATLMVDNTAVAGSVRRGYSRNRIACRWMREYFLGKIDIEVVSVISADNEADGLSRLKAGCVNLPLALEIADGHFQGQRVSSGQATAAQSRSGCLRHPEGLNPDSELELVIEDEDDMLELVLEEQIREDLDLSEETDDETRAREAEESWYVDGPDDPRES